jgi:hypothetical protein
MKSPIVVGCLCCVVFAMVSISAQENYRGGIVYGPKAAFNIAAPEGWVLDNQAGVEQGLPCVLYPKGSSWADAKTIMYAKIASTQFEDVNAFVATAIKEMAKTHGKPKEKIASGKTHDAHDYFINEYPATKNYSQWERVAYVQLPLRRFHRSLIARSRELPERFRCAAGSTENLYISRAQARLRKALSPPLFD